MNDKVKTFLAIALAIAFIVFWIPEVFKHELTFAIPALALLSYAVCRLAGTKLSSGAKLAALLSGELFYLCIATIWFVARDSQPQVVNVAVLVTVAIVGLLIGYVTYILRPLWMKASFVVVSLAFVGVLYFGGEKACMNRIYYGSWNGNVAETLAYPLELSDEDGTAVEFDVASSKYSVIQFVRIGHGYSFADVNDSMLPSFERYRGDERVQFMVVGDSAQAQESVSSEAVVAMGLPYAISANPQRTAEMLIHRGDPGNSAAIVKDGVLIFRGDSENVYAKLDELLAL